MEYFLYGICALGIFMGFGIAMQEEGSEATPFVLLAIFFLIAIHVIRHW